MMNVTVLTVGKLKERYLRDGCAEYLKRLQAYAKVNMIEVSEERVSDNPSAAELAAVLKKEGERLTAKIPKGATVITLCIEGQQYDSPSFAALLEQTAQSSAHLCFIIGGSFGLSDEVKALSKYRLSFGKLTLPHQLARLVLLEQVYRAFSISNHAKYHK